MLLGIVSNILCCWELFTRRKQKNKANFTLECFFDGIRIWSKYIFIVFHYRFNITHSNLGGEITLQSRVTETVNNNGIFLKKQNITMISYMFW